MSSNSFFLRNSYQLGYKVGKYGRSREATDNNITRRMRFACWMSKATDIHSEYERFIAL